MPKLFEIAKQAGFTQESFDKCLTDQKLLDNITAGRTRASDVFGVSATPDVLRQRQSGSTRSTTDVDGRRSSKRSSRCCAKS